MPSFDYQGNRIAYREYGEGERVIVLTHGLLMNGHMYDRLAPDLAKAGNRVLTIDVLGHGASDKPEGELRHYSMTAMGDQVISLLDHIGVEQAVLGGTSLGANVSLEAAVAHPERVRGLFIEMPVLENALVAVAAIFSPIIVGLRFGAPLVGLLSRVANLVPRTHYLADIGLDWLRRSPESSLTVLKGLLLGRTGPPPAERQRITAPALVVGHPSDPLHPFSDSGMVVEELDGARLVEADSIIEWRLRPERLTDELVSFLDEVWAETPQAAGV